MGSQRAEIMPPAMADEALRRQVARWVREALGELVEDDETEYHQLVAASLALRYSTVAEARRANRCDGAPGRTIHKKEE
jgi:hypothetical protein